MSKLTPEQARRRITEIDKEISNTEKMTQHLENLETERQELQNLLETTERNQKVNQAKKRQAEIMKQGNKELHKIYNAQQTVTQALEKLEPLKRELWNLQNQFHQLKNMSFNIPTPTKKFTYPGAVPKEWAKL